MKVEALSAVQSHASAQSQQPRTKAKAHGLVRRLQEDTFNGASVEKHRARFSDRLTETSVVDASVPNDASQIEEAYDTTTEAPAVSPSTLDAVGSDAGLLDVADYTGEAGTQWYGDQNALYMLGESGQKFDWTA